MAVIIIPTTYDAASPDAVSALNGNAYGYDANGNQTTVKVPPTELLVFLDRLALPQLGREERLAIIESLKQAIWPNSVGEHALPTNSGLVIHSLM